MLTITTDLGNWLNGNMLLYSNDLLRPFAIARYYSFLNSNNSKS